MRSLTQEARQSMQQRLYTKAITLYDEHLEGQPDDLRSLMEVGICHLLNGSEEAFLYIHQSMKAVISKNAPLTDENRELWDYYLSLVRKVTATALVIGSVAVTGCQGEGKPSFSGHKYSGGVQMSPEPPVQQKAEDNQSSSTTNTTSVNSIVTPTNAKPHFSAHRYSGGVYMQKKRVQTENSKTENK